jgi:uncharacterized membrane protein YfcA
MEHSLTAYALGAIAAMLVGLSKTGVPGAAIPAVLLTAEAFAGEESLSVGALLPMLLVGDLFAVRFYRKHTQWNRLWRLLPFVVIGMIPGALVLKYVDHGQFRLILGWLVLMLLGLELCRRRFNWTDVPKRWWFAATMGLLAGFGTTVGNAAGPVMGIYLISQGLRKEQFMGTAAWFFFIVNAAKLPIYASLGRITPATLQFDLVMIPIVVVAALVGRRLFSIIPQKVFDPLVLALAGISALRLVGVSFIF